MVMILNKIILYEKRQVKAAFLKGEWIMKKRIIRCFLMFAGVASIIGSFTACSGQKAAPETEMTDLPLDDFTGGTSNIMTATPEGYYAVTGGFLYYISADLQESTVVCSKPNCIHNELNVENMYDYTACDAYFWDARQIDYYNGSLYVSENNGMGTDIYKVSLDGTEKTLYYQSQPDCMLSIYNGYAYLAEKVYLTDGVVNRLTGFPVEDPDKAEVLFETDEYQNSTINRMRFYDGYCYFLLFDPAETGKKGDSAYFRADLKSGDTEQMYDQLDGGLEWNDYGLLIESKDYITFDPTAQWTSKYYHIQPDTGEETELTENDFSAIGTNDGFANMDDKYIYFRTMASNGEEMLPEERMVKVYDYEGNQQAQIPVSNLGATIWVLPGTDEYLFIQTLNVQDGSYELWYADKFQFEYQ